jgi:hypothetical protein
MGYGNTTPIEFRYVEFCQQHPVLSVALGVLALVVVVLVAIWFYRTKGSWHIDSW